MKLAPLEQRCLRLGPSTSRNRLDGRQRLYAASLVGLALFRTGTSLFMKLCTQFVISVQYKHRECVQFNEFISLRGPRSERGVQRAAWRRAVLALQDEPGKRLDAKQAAAPSPSRTKKVTRAAALQESLSFSDAWAARNRGRIDVWFVIGLLFILLPLGILIWGVATGVIPYMS